MRRRRRCGRFRGLGLVEVMVSLAIAASLLTATGMALNAAVRAYHVNQQQATLLQATRVALNRMLTDIRGTKLHAPASATLANQFAGGLTVTGTGLSMIDDTDAVRTYKYDATNQQIVVTVNGKTRVLLRGVTAFDVTMEPMRSATSVRTGGSWDLLKRATMNVKVKSVKSTSAPGEATGSMVMTLSASVMPRRNAW